MRTRGERCSVGIDSYQKELAMVQLQQSAGYGNQQTSWGSLMTFDSEKPLARMWTHHLRAFLNFVGFHSRRAYLPYKLQQLYERAPQQPAEEELYDTAQQDRIGFDSYQRPCRQFVG
jgi:hypothetical protein